VAEIGAFEDNDRAAASTFQFNVATNPRDGFRRLEIASGADDADLEIVLRQFHGLRLRPPEGGSSSRRRIGHETLDLDARLGPKCPSRREHLVPELPGDPVRQMGMSPVPVVEIQARRRPKPVDGKLL